MTSALLEPPTLLRRRWWGMVLAVFLFQLGAIFWLGEREPIRPRPVTSVPRLHLVEGGSVELLALTDPTLFALPHRQGFSGLAWLKSPALNFGSFAWSEPPRWLRLSTDLLGTAFEPFIATNTFNPLLALSQSEPQLRVPQLSVTRDFPERSMFRVTGGLSSRRLLSAIDLPNWANPEILTNSRVRLAVDATGKPVSATLLYPGSGLKDADTSALSQASRARFAPSNIAALDAANAISELTWGEMIFEWHTLPVPLTNTAQGVK